MCTIEKANVCINRLVQQGRLQELCCVVVDVRPLPFSAEERLNRRDLLFAMDMARIHFSGALAVQRMVSL